MAPFLVLLATAISATDPHPAAIERGALDALKTRTTAELLACVERRNADELYCGARLADVGAELGSRGASRELVAAFGASSPTARSAIVHALYRDESAEVAALMESAAFGPGAGALQPEALDRAKVYLGKRCDARVLREWSSRPFELRSPAGEGSGGASSLVPYFARCRYEPAIPYLLWLLDAASLNVVMASEEALRVFFPNDEQLRSIPQAKAFYTERFEKSRRR